MKWRFHRALAFVGALLLLNSCDSRQAMFPILNLGNIPEGNVCYWRYVTSVPSGVTKVSRVTASCTCVKVLSWSYNANTQKVEIDGSVNPEKFNGAFVSTISVLDKSYTSVSHFDVKGEVTPVFELIEQSKSLEPIKKNDKPVTWTFEGKDGPCDIAWTDATATSKLASVSAKRIESKKVVFTATLDPNSLPIGAFHNQIEISLWNKGKLLPYRYYFNYRGVVIDDVVSIPTSVFLRGTEKKTVEETIRIISQSGQYLTYINYISPINDQCTFQLVSPPSGQELSFKLTSRKNLSGNFFGNIKITIGENKQRKVLSLPVLGISK